MTTYQLIEYKYDENNELHKHKRNLNDLHAAVVAIAPYVDDVDIAKYELYKVTDGKATLLCEGDPIDVLRTVNKLIED